MTFDFKLVILVTDGNQNLDHETLKILARINEYNIVVVVRTQSKIEKIIKIIAAETSNSDLTSMIIDLNNDDIIFDAVKIVEKKFNHLNVLVNNAEINRSSKFNVILRENFRVVFEINVFDVTVMNHIFLFLIRKSIYFQRRIVTIISDLKMFDVVLTESSLYNVWNYKFLVYRSSKSVVNIIFVVDMIAFREKNIANVLVESEYCWTIFEEFQNHKNVDENKKIIARAAVERDNKDLFLKIIDDESKHVQFNW